MVVVFGGIPLFAGALAVALLTSEVEVSTADAVMFGVIVGLLTLIILLLAFLLVGVWGYRP